MVPLVVAALAAEVWAGTGDTVTVVVSAMIEADGEKLQSVVE